MKMKDSNKMKKYEYIKIQNKDDKVWKFPVNNLKVGLNLYQPSSIKGKVLKRFLPLCLKTPVLDRVVKKIMHITPSCLNIPEGVVNTLKNVYGKKDVEYAVFEGTPCTHQKTTVQIAQGKHILGYAKFSKKKSVQELFLKEKEILEWLHASGLNNIPKCVLCEATSDGQLLFIQDTKKTTSSKVSHKLGRAHQAFLSEMSEKTETMCDYERSDYYIQLEALKKNLDVLEKAGIGTESIIEAIAVVEKKLENEKNFSAYHGDFTPWNTFVLENEEIYVFDFEYAMKTYPKHLDAFHFFTQTMIYQKDKSAKEIMEMFESKHVFKQIQKLFENPYVSYLQYLISIIGFYVKRDGDNLNQNNIHNFNVWNELIQYNLRNAVRGKE